MLRAIARRTTQIQVPAGGDQILFGISLPSGSVIHDIRAKISLIANSDVVRSVASMAAIEGWILPVHDPDAGNSLENLWDRLVPKDTDDGVLDIDTGAVDTSPFFEPGEVDLSAMFDVGVKPERLYHRHRLYTMADALFSYQDNQSTFLVKYFAGEKFMIHIGRRLRVRQPSVLVFALASPQMDDTTNVAPVSLAEAEWPQVKYFGDMLKRALLDVLGVIEAGAETPWEEASALIQRYLDPDVYEEVAGSIEAMTWNAFCEATMDFSVEGELGKSTISTGR